MPTFIDQEKSQKQKVLKESTAEEVSFEWSKHRISSTDSTVRTILHVSIIDSGSERVNKSVYNIQKYKYLKTPRTETFLKSQRV